jgi:WD40 repeat protein
MARQGRKRQVSTHERNYTTHPLRALRVSPQVLNRDLRQLLSQRVGRLGDFPLRSTELTGLRLRLTIDSLIQSGRALMRILSSHYDRVSNCAFSPDGRLLANVSADQTARFLIAGSQNLQRV